MRLRWGTRWLGLVGIFNNRRQGLVGEGDVDWVSFDYAVAGGWGLRDDGADGGDGVGDGLGEGWGGGVGWGLCGLGLRRGCGCFW